MDDDYSTEALQQRLAQQAEEAINFLNDQAIPWKQESENRLYSLAERIVQYGQRIKEQTRQP